MKKTMLALLLCLCVAALSACSGGGNDRYSPGEGDSLTQPTQNVSGAATDAPPSGETDYDSGDYDPASEEGLGAEDPSLGANLAQTPVYTAAPTVYSQFAGATAVPVDPIDKPTPTPVPPLTFTYQVYDATNLGLSFEGPIGWVTDDSAAEDFVIYNPDPAMDYMATMTLHASAVTNDYSESELNSYVKTWLNTIGATGFSDYSPSNTASRTLLGHNGTYANYSGTLTDGTKVAGRIHAVCVNRVLYTVHITYPLAYRDTYVDNVYHKLRETITITRR